MPAPAGQAAIARGLDGRFYLFGGWNTNPPTITQTKKLQIYDAGTDTWTLGASLPVPSVGDAAVVIPSGRIHLLNAYNQRIHPYDPNTNTWGASQAAPWLQYAMRAIGTSDNRFFVFGGERPDSLTYEYFPDSFSAQPRADIPYCPDPSEQSVLFPGVYVETADEIHVVGGMPNWSQLYGALDNVAVYHPQTDTWTENLKSMPTKRFAFAFVRGWNDCFYAIGGSDVYFMQASPHFDAVEVYDPQNDGWASGAPLPEGRREAAAGVDDNGVIYIFGGCGPDKQYKTTVYALDTRVGIAGPAPADFDRDGDVDEDDLVYFESCATGPSLAPVIDGCQSADLDGDNDVDQNDFGLFQRCFSGRQMRVDPHCAQVGNRNIVRP